MSRPTATILGVERPPAYAQPRTEPLDLATERAVALRDAWRAFALSRALI
jgi:hypothetical protein